MSSAALAAACCVLLAVALALPPGDRALPSSLAARRGSRLLAALAEVAGHPRRLRSDRSATDPSTTGPSTDPSTDPALVLELLAAALTAGAHPAVALAAVGEAVGGTDGAALRAVANRMRLGARETALWAAAPPGAEDLRRCLSLSARTGAPASLLLREAAAERRRAVRRTQEAAAQRVGVRLVLPLGLCALPAFAAWGIVPVVLGLARTVALP